MTRKASGIRAKFEALHRRKWRHLFDVTFSCGRYTDPLTQERWELYRAGYLAKRRP